MLVMRVQKMITNLPVRDKFYIHGLSICCKLYLSWSLAISQAVQAYSLSLTRFDLASYTVWLH